MGTCRQSRVRPRGSRSSNTPPDAARPAAPLQPATDGAPPESMPPGTRVRGNPHPGNTMIKTATPTPRSDCAVRHPPSTRRPGGEFLPAGEGLFDLPADSGYPHQRAQRHRGRCVRTIEAVPPVVDAAADQQPVLDV